MTGKLDRLSEVLIDQKIVKEIIGSAQVERFGGSTYIVYSPNGIDHRAICVNSEGNVTHDEFIAWEEMQFLPTAEHFADWCVYWSELDFFFYMEEKVLNK